MCGVAGFLSRDRFPRDAEQVARAMACAVSHRGPDDAGVWIDNDAGIAMGHRRLAIVDLSAEGHQPMISASGRYVMVYNGEVYNFRELASELRGRGARFRGHSDTEVMLAAFEAWGLDAALQRFAGMFAFALWDRTTRRLSLVRDRIGEKPLYFGRAGNAMVFGSELKSLRAHPGFAAAIDRGAVALFMRYNYIPAPFSIYDGIRKVVPGTIVEFDAATTEPRERVYWSARQAAEDGVANPIVGSELEIVDEFERAMRRTIREEMVADVPLGAFLSGGIDSSGVVAIMQAESPRPVKTFTIGFREAEYDEASHARAVARHLGTEHTEFVVTPEEAMAVVPTLSSLYDEPFGDSSQIPTCLVARLARRHVTVSLSGDGGDELLGGYNRYFLGERIWKTVGSLPIAARRLMGHGLRAVPVALWNQLFGSAMALVPRARRLSVPGDKMHKLGAILGVDAPEAMYRDLVSHWREPSSVTIGGVEHVTLLSDHKRWARIPDFTQRMMYLDLVTYLPDDIMVKVDRASMGVSLETRAPFLDHRLTELAWRVPQSLKVRESEGKWLLRQILHRYVPRALVERPKMGFGVPIDHWLRGPLKEWALELIEPARVRREGFLVVDAVQEKWNEHQSGQRNWQHLLWGILMFQAWLEECAPA